VDRAALDFGLDRQIAVGGWCPKDRYAEDGPIDARYPLRETEQAEVTFRTEFNARDSDGSLVLVENHLMRGTGYTREMAIRHEKPYWIQPVDAPFDKEQFARWLIANNIRVLNIGGPRESDQPGSVYDNARALLEKIID
jgi:PAS domain-containing protein